MTNKTLRYGLIGCGMMGQEHLRNLALIPGSHVAALFDPNHDNQQQAGRLAPQAALEPSLEQLLKRQDLDALIIASPSHQHAAQLAIICQETQLPVLIEKPLCTTLSEVHALRPKLQQHPASLWVAMKHRHIAAITLLKALSGSGQLGEIVQMSIRQHRPPLDTKLHGWNLFNKNTGGTLVEQCCNFFDLIRFLLNDEPSRIYASGGQNINHLNECHNGQQPDLLDNAFVVMDFPSGKRALLEMSLFAANTPYQERITLVGTQAKTECRLPKPLTPAGSADDPQNFPCTIELTPLDTQQIERFELPQLDSLPRASEPQGSIYYQHEGFRQAVLHGAEVDINLDDGLRAVVIGLAAQASIESGQAMRFTDNGFNFTVH